MRIDLLKHLASAFHLRFDECLTQRLLQADAPYSTQDKAAVSSFWDGATAHTGIAELRAKRGHPVKNEQDRKEQIALRLDADKRGAEGLSGCDGLILAQLLQFYRIQFRNKPPQVRVAAVQRHLPKPKPFHRIELGFIKTDFLIASGMHNEPQ